MQVSRVTWSIRNDIQSNITALFTTRLNEIADQLQEPVVGDETYNLLVSQDLQAKLDAVKGWISTSRCATIWYGNRGSFRVSFSTEHYIPSRVALKYPPDGPDSQFKRLAEAYFALDNEKNEICKALTIGVIDKCTNVTQIMQVWPSVLEYMSPHNRDKIRENAEANRKTKRKRPKTAITISDDIKAKLIRLRMLNELNKNPG